MLWLLSVGLVVGLILGIFAGMRLQLARGRVRELRRSLDRMRNVDSLENAFLETMKQRQAFEASGQTHHVRVINVIQFIIIWNWDLTTLLDQLRAIPEAWSLEAGWRKKLLARTLALTAYESLSKLAQTFDPANDRKWSLRRAIRALGCDTVLATDLDSMHQNINGLLEKHAELLSGIRTNIIGHRDQDAAAQMLWMRKADATELETLGWELLALTNQALSVMSTVVATVAKSLPKHSAPEATT